MNVVDEPGSVATGAWRRRGLHAQVPIGDPDDDEPGYDDDEDDEDDDEERDDDDEDYRLRR